MLLYSYTVLDARNLTIGCTVATAVKPKQRWTTLSNLKKIVIDWPGTDFAFLIL